MGKIGPFGQIKLFYLNNRGNDIHSILRMILNEIFIAKFK